MRSLGSLAVFFSFWVAIVSQNATATPLTGSCIDGLSLMDQTQRFSRVVNLGASFTHGCMTCDNGNVTSEMFELTGDSFWLRRSILMHFFKDRLWKGLGKQNLKFYVLENDPTRKPVSLVDSNQILRDGYSGLWHYEPKYDAVQLLSKAEAIKLQQKTDILADAGLVGGLEWRPDLKIRKSKDHGVLYAAYDASNGKPFAQGFDLALDGGKIEDLFLYHGAAAEYAELDKTKWAPSSVLTRAIQKTANRILEMKPSVVISMDSLFWDAISRTGALAIEKGTSSVVLKFILSIVKNTPDGTKMFDQERSVNIREAYLETLRLISLGNENHTGVPVYLARLLDNALNVFKEKKYEAVIASLIGSFVNQLTGIDVQGRLLQWLTKESKSNNLMDLSISAKDNASEPNLSPSERRKLREALRKLQEGISSEPTNQKGKSELGIPMRAIGTLLLSNVLKESPKLLEYLSTSFNETNEALRLFLRTKQHNIHLTNADEFYGQFASFLKPETMHPHFQGASKFGNLLAQSLCGKEETP